MPIISMRSDSGSEEGIVVCFGIVPPVALHAEGDRITRDVVTMTLGSPKAIVKATLFWTGLTLRTVTQPRRRGRRNRFVRRLYMPAWSGQTGLVPSPA